MQPTGCEQFRKDVCLNMKLSSKLAVLGGFLAGAGAVALAVIKHKQREEIYHEAELKAMEELNQMMDQADECADCSCAEECAALDKEPQAEAPAEAPEPAQDAEKNAEEKPAEETSPAEEPKAE